MKHFLPPSRRMAAMKATAAAAQVASALARIARALEKTTHLKRIVKLHLKVSELLLRIRTLALGRNLLHRAAGLKLRAERKAGKLLRELHIRGGDHKSARAAIKLTLARLRVSKKQSSDWQLEAQLPEDDFASYLRQTAVKGKLPSSHGLCRLARMHVESLKLAGNSADDFGRVLDGLRALARQGKRFACILIDSPCAPVRSDRANDFHFDPRLAQLPLMQVAAPQTHFYLRATLESCEEGAKVLAAWGLVWKATVGRKEVWRDPDALWEPVRDLWLLGVRGASGCNDYGLPHWTEGAGTLPETSAGALYRFVESVSRPPYLDLFGSRPFSKDWTIAINQRRGSK